MIDSVHYQALLGSKIRDTRASIGWSLHEAARQSSGRFSPAALGSYERGDRQMSATTLAALADLYDTAIADLLPTIPSAIPGPRTPIDQQQNNGEFDITGGNPELVGVLDLDRIANHRYTSKTPLGVAPWEVGDTPGRRRSGDG